MPSPLCPVLSDDESDTILGPSEVFSNNVSDSNSSTILSDVDSSESEPDFDDESNDESEDEVVLEDEEE